MRKILPVLLAIAILTSCRKKLEWPGWDVNLIFPVASTSLRITDLVKDSLLKVNPDQSLSVVYSGEVYKLNIDSLFDIPDTAIFQSFKCLFCGTGFPYQPNQTVTYQTQNTKYNLNSVELTEVIIRSGSIEVELRSTFQGKTMLVYQLPLAKDSNGNALSITDTLPAASPGNPSILIKSYDLSGYRIDLRGVNGNSFNTLVSNFKAVTLEATTVTSSDSVRILNTFKDIVPEFAKGYFGQTVVETEAENQAVKKLKNISGGTFDLKDFDLKLKIRNGVGADIQVLLNEVSSSNISTGENVQLISPAIGSAININRAVISGSSAYPPLTYSEYLINMNNTNSNADDLIEIFPDSILSSSKITLNPLGNISNSNDFVYYGNGITVSLDAEVPLHLAANNLILSDTVPLDFSPEQKENDPAKKVAGGFLVLDVYNRYPFTAKPQLYLMNENFQVNDSLVTESSVIEAAELNSNLYASGKKFSKVFIPVNQDKIEKLRAAKNMLVKLFFSTASSSHVKIYSEYEIEIKIVADINYIIGKN